jgi:hypothetical protein
MSNNDNNDSVGDRGCWICGLIGAAGCPHHPPMADYVAVAPREVAMQVSRLRLEETSTTVLMNPRTGLPLMGADLVEALRKKAI